MENKKHGFTLRGHGQAHKGHKEPFTSEPVTIALTMPAVKEPIKQSLSPASKLTRSTIATRPRQFPFLNLR